MMNICYTNNHWQYINDWNENMPRSPKILHWYIRVLHFTTYVLYGPYIKHINLFYMLSSLVVPNTNNGLYNEKGISIRTCLVHNDLNHLFNNCRNKENHQVHQILCTNTNKWLISTFAIFFVNNSNTSFDQFSIIKFYWLALSKWPDFIAIKVVPINLIFSMARLIVTNEGKKKMVFGWQAL